MSSAVRSSVVRIAEESHLDSHRSVEQYLPTELGQLHAVQTLAVRVLGRPEIDPPVLPAEQLPENQENVSVYTSVLGQEYNPGLSDHHSNSVLRTYPSHFV